MKSKQFKRSISDLEKEIQNLKDQVANLTKLLEQKWQPIKEYVYIPMPPIQPIPPNPSPWTPPIPYTPPWQPPNDPFWNPPYRVYFGPTCITCQLSGSTEPIFG
jgi:hypothetical protein